MNWRYTSPRSLDRLQQTALSLMVMLTLLTFVAANVHAMLWQSSEWLVSTVLPAVVVELTNEERSTAAAPPLQRNQTLDAAARLKAEHMAKEEYFSHFSPNGVSPWHWFDEAGYTYAHAGENLAIHFTDSAEIVEAWMHSPLHRKNIVNNQYTEIGVGTAQGEYEGYKTVYVVQLFGTPAVPETEETETVPIITPEPSVVAEELPDFYSTTTAVAVVEAPTSTPNSTPTANATATALTLAAAADETVETGNATHSPAVVPHTAPIATGAPAGSFAESENTLHVTEAKSPDTKIIRRSLIATSSGLAVANMSPTIKPHAGATVASIATQPNALLQSLYVLLGSVVVMLLLASIVLEMRRLHLVQVAYGVLLLVGMGGLWYAHALLTTGAVIA